MAQISVAIGLPMTDFEYSPLATLRPGDIALIFAEA